MPQSKWSPSIVPDAVEQTVYLVLDCSGRESDMRDADFETVISSLMLGQYSDPHRVVAFNTSECGSQDVSRNIAIKIQRRSDNAHEDLGSAIEVFVNRHAGGERHLPVVL